MSPDKMFPNSPVPASRDEATHHGAEAPARSAAALALLAHALDEAASSFDAHTEPPGLLERELVRWIQQSFGRDERHTVELSDAALDIIAALSPDASLTGECLARVEAKRKAARHEADALRRAAERCDAGSPGELFRTLRTRSGLGPEPAAQALGITSPTLLAIEAKQAPWYQVKPNALVDFAALVREPIAELVALLHITARRLLLTDVQQRVTLALGRFDKTQQASDARRSRVRLAFTRLQGENRAAAAFFVQARCLTEHGDGRATKGGDNVE